MTAKRGEALSMDMLGSSSRRAIRSLLTAFRQQGWRDDGAALLIVDRLEASPRPVSVSTLAKEVPRDFLALNGIRRADIEDVLRRLSQA